MLDKLISHEADLFFSINGTRNCFLDSMMWLYSGMKIWMPLAVFFIFMLMYKKNWQKWLPVLLAIVLVFACCDLFSSHLIKPLFQRARPTHYPDIMEHVKILYGYTGGQYGFISGHATNSFGFAMFTALLFRNKSYSIFIFLWAFVMVYSRVYLGVHFISDIVGGIVAGLLIGFGVYKLYIRAVRKLQFAGEACYAKGEINVLTLVSVFYILLFSVLGEVLILFLK